ncbi:MAG: lysine--tRNA ligase [Frankiaceae bacterium]|nr:lysine--tRNA ligase [Frankiaceae bacterium]
MRRVDAASGAAAPGDATPPDSAPGAPHGASGQCAAGDRRDPLPGTADARLAAGPDQVAYRFDATWTAAALASRWDRLAPDERADEQVALAGRLMLIRRHGGLIFAVLRDRTGSIQLIVDRGAVGEAVHGAFRGLDRGDWIGVRGAPTRTRRGELSVALSGFELLGKATRALPDADQGPAGAELRYRQRHVDLLSREQTRRIFQIRRAAIQAIRRHLEDRGFWEVEGPMLHSTSSGAAGRPFVTRHDALDGDSYLRDALELHLKRLVVGGMERVFEIGRVFRNEGPDARDNPEFTVLEAYQAFADYHDMMDLVEGMVAAAAAAARGGDMVVQVRGRAVDLSPPWPRVTMSDLIAERLGAVMDPGMPIEGARAVLDAHGVAWESSWGAGRAMKQLVDERIQPEVIEPLFCLDYPQEVSPLARAHRGRAGYVERFGLMVAGFELCHAYSEQNDPDAQRRALEDRARAKAHGDPRAGDVDEDYLRAVEHGMPCAGGLGLGIDRLVMLLAEVDSVREVILFPAMPPEPGAATPAGPAGASPAGNRLGRLDPLGAGPPADPEAAAGPEPPAAPATRRLGELAPADLLKRWREERRMLRWIGAFAGIGSVLMLLTLIPFVRDRSLGQIHPLGPVWFRVTGHLLTLGIALCLLFLAGQLGRGKRRAWQFSVALFLIGVASNTIKGPHPLSVAYCAAMAATLLAHRQLFQGRSDPPSLFRFLRLVPVYIGAVLAFGLGSLYLERGRLSGHLTLPGALETIGNGLVGIGGPYEYQRLFFREFFPRALVLLGVFGVVGAAYLLFRPLRSRAPHTDADWAHARRLVRAHGSDTLAYFALRDDKSFFFGSDGEALIAYTYLGGFALVSGDPIGAPGSIDPALDEFLLFCHDRAWKVAFLAVRTTELPRYEARGLRSFYLGDEAILMCDRFSLDGPAMKGLRSAVRRVERSYRFEVLRESEASATLVRQLNAISAQWRGKSPERGFTMSLSQEIEGAGRNPEFLLCVALDEAGSPGGFLRIVPAYGPDFGYTLDLMRHRPDAPNGMTEFLIARTAAALRREGIARLSMNFALWGRLYGKDVPYLWSQRMARRAVSVLNPFFQIKSLHDFNERFSPSWLSRELVYEETTDLPRVGLLYAGAEGFLAMPVIGDLLVPRAVGGASANGPDPRGGHAA